MKNFQYLLALAVSASLLFMLNSCKKEIDETPTSGYVFSPEELAHIHQNFCNTLSRPNAADDRATGLKGKFWPKGTVLRVKFLNGSPALKSKVLNAAKIWEQYAENISFEESNSRQAEIRVQFGLVGNDSQIGTDNLKIREKSGPTMHLQFTRQSTDEYIRAVALHEFGHALGLDHEHQNPMANIQWNIPKVYAYYKQTDNWDPPTVDENVLNTLGWGPAQHTVFDPESIMAYPIPDSLTTNGFSIPWNTELSDLDKEFIGKMYNTLPFNHIRHAADINTPITFLLNGIYTTLEKDSSIIVPVNNPINTLEIWECPDGCTWSPFEVTMLIGYKIVSDPDNPNDLTLEQDAGYLCAPKSKPY